MLRSNIHHRCCNFILWRRWNEEELFYSRNHICLPAGLMWSYFMCLCPSQGRRLLSARLQSRRSQVFAHFPHVHSDIFSMKNSSFSVCFYCLRSVRVVSIGSQLTYSIVSREMTLICQQPPPACRSLWANHKSSKRCNVIQHRGLYKQ